MAPPGKRVTGDRSCIYTDAKGARVVICEFESLAKALEWYDSPEYARAKEAALKHATRNVIFLEGAS